MPTVSTEPQPLYCVYRVEDRSLECFRSVANNPAQVGDFLTFADIGQNFEWWEHHRAVGVSAFTKVEKAVVLAAKKGHAWVARIDLSKADGRTPWAQTGRDPDHITIWAPAPVLLPAVVNYIKLGKGS